jgi:hypothetical protein
MRTTYHHNRRGGHCPGHVRETFLAALDAYAEWASGEPEPTVDFEVKYVPRAIPISKAAGLVWSCSDILPSDAVSTIEETDLAALMQSCTYASAARALKQRVQDRAA